VTQTVLPPTLRLTILRRVSFLPEPTLQALRSASVLGSGFTLTDLATVTSRPAVDLSVVLSEAIRARVPEDDGARLRFRHELIRDAIYQDDGLGAVAEVEFGQDAADVGLGGLLGDDQGAADLGVGQTVGDQPQYLGLPLGERSEAGRERPGRTWLAGEVGDQPAGHRRGQQGVACGDHADRVYELGGGGVLDQEAAGAGPERLIDVFVEVEGGEHQHSRPVRAGGGAEDLAGCLQPVHDRHPHVHQHDIGLQLVCLANRGGTVSGLSHDQQAWLGVEDRGEALPHHCLVVGDQAPRRRVAACRSVGCHAALPRGRTAETTKPPSGDGPADSEPPSSATRSRIPASP
jgi:hypothetical protein